MSPTRTRRGGAVSVLLLALVLPLPLAAQWSGKASATGSAFFGTSDQRVFGTRGSLSRRDSVVEFSLSGEVVYGDAKRELERREVSKRTLHGSISIDYRPFAPVSPFLAVTGESNFEKRIEGRYSIAIGAKRTFVQTKASEASLSASVLDEYTVPRMVGTTPVETSRITRYSLRGRFRHTFDERLRASHTTFYQPSARFSSRYLVRSTTEAQYALTKVFSLTSSLQYNYDSEATVRGAKVNYDGQMMFGLGASW